MSEKIRLVYVASVSICKELFHKRSEASKALDNRVHVASVAEILESSKASLDGAMNGHKKLEIVNLLDALSRRFRASVKFSS